MQKIREKDYGYLAVVLNLGNVNKFLALEKEYHPSLLELAIGIEDPILCEILLKRCANVGLFNSKIGSSPLLAATYIENSSSKNAILQLLLKNGAYKHPLLKPDSSEKDEEIDESSFLLYLLMEKIDLSLSLPYVQELLPTSQSLSKAVFKLSDSRKDFIPSMQFLLQNGHLDIREIKKAVSALENKELKKLIERYLQRHALIAHRLKDDNLGTLTLAYVGEEKYPEEKKNCIIS